MKIALPMVIATLADTNRQISSNAIAKIAVEIGSDINIAFHK